MVLTFVNSELMAKIKSKRKSEVNFRDKLLKKAQDANQKLYQIDRYADSNDEYLRGGETRTPKYQSYPRHQIKTPQEVSLIDQSEQLVHHIALTNYEKADDCLTVIPELYEDPEQTQTIFVYFRNKIDEFMTDIPSEEEQEVYVNFIEKKTDFLVYPRWFQEKLRER